MLQNSQFNKIRQDLRQNAFRVLLVLLSVIVSTAVLSTISSAFWVLKREMNANFLGTNPADAMLWFVPDSNKNIISTLQIHPSVSTAELRQIIEGRVEIAPNNWETLNLFVVNDFNNLQINTFKLEDGQLPKAKGEAVIERSCMSVAKRQIGETLTVSVENGNRATLKISGTVHDPAEPPGWMHGEVNTYIHASTLEKLGLPTTQNAVKIKLKNQSTDRLVAQQEVLKITQFIENQGFKIVRTNVPPPAMHPHDRQLKAILSILMVFSCIILILSSVVIANMMNGFLARQTKQIGMMKAIGGSTQQISRLYFGFISSMILVAVPLGWLLSFPMVKIFTTFISNQLNFSVLNSFSPLWLSVLQVFVCMVIPLLFGMLPVQKAMKKTVLSALNNVDLKTGTTTFWKSLGNYISRPLLLTIRNTFRQKRRFWLTMSSLALGGAAYMASFNVQSAWKSTIAAVEAKQRYDIDVKLFNAVPISQFDSLVKNIPTIENYEAWSSIKTYIKYDDNTESMRFELSGMPENPQFYTPTIQEGQALDTHSDDKEIVATRSLIFLEPRLKVGDNVKLRIDNQFIPFKLVGITYEADAEPTFYASKATIDRIRQTSSLAAHFRLNTTQKRDAAQSVVLKQIETGMTQKNWSIRLTKEAHVLEQNFKDHFTIIVNMLLVIAFFLASVGFLGLSSTLSMNVLERMKEFGMMQACGATSRQIGQLILTEGLIMGLLSWLLAIVIALPISYGMDTAIGNVGLLKPLDFIINWVAIFGWLGIILLVSVVVGLFPAYQANRVSVREILSYE
jgi:putative ABC transport system permease protein